MSFITAAIIGGGAAIAGGVIASNSASDAASKQAGATDKAVGASQAQYGQTRTDLAPYRDAGSAALSRLSQLLGVGQDQTTPGASVSDADLAAIAQHPDVQAYLQSVGASPDKWMQDAKNNLSAGAYGNDRASQLAAIQRGFGTVGVTGDVTAGLPASAGPSSGSSDSSGYGSMLRNFAPSDLNADPIYKSALDFSTQQGERAINARRAATGGYDSGAALKELGTFDQGNASTLAGDAFNRFNTNRNTQNSMLSGLVGTGLSAAGATSNAGTANSSNLSNLYTGQGNAAAAAGIAGGNAISGGINGAIGNYNSNQLLAQLTGGGQRAGAGGITPYNGDPTMNLGYGTGGGY